MKNILSLFNGISALHLACDKAGFEIDTCYYAEIDKYANKVTEQHYPNDVALGDVTKWREWDIDWTDCISNTQQYKSLGNAWTIDVIAHILKCI